MKTTRSTYTRIIRMFVLHLTFMLLIGPLSAQAEVEVDPEESAAAPSVSTESSVSSESKEEKDKPFYRDSSLSYKNTATAISLNKDAEPTYNPFWLMSFGIAPRFWTGDKGHLFLNIEISREITNSDWTTKEGETILSDITFGAGINIYTIPVLDIAITPKLTFITPSSKASRARTLTIGIQPGLSLSRAFDVLEGLSLAYSLGVTKNFHSSTTAESEEAVIDDIKTSAAVSTRSMASYMNTGVRNASAELVNMFSAGIDFVSWLGMGINFGIAHSFLYEMEDDYESVYGDNDLEISYDPTENPSDIRYSFIYGAELHGTPHKALTITLGAATANPMLARDSTYETPIVNRYTAIYLDLRFNIAGLVSVFSTTKE